jgi:hypothetical protein
LDAIAARTASYEIKKGPHQMSITDQILSEREQTHGLFREVAGYSQAIKQLMRSARNWNRLDVAQAQALEVVADKVARILCGDPSFPDHWQDGAGYFELVLRDLVQAQAPVTMPRATMPELAGDEPLDAPAFLTEGRS